LDDANEDLERKYRTIARIFGKDLGLQTESMKQALRQRAEKRREAVRKLQGMQAMKEELKVSKNPEKMPHHL
jgi:hypothetical protein